MKYKGKKITCGITDLMMVPATDGDIVIGYYDEYDSFVKVDVCKTQDEANDTYTKIMDMLISDDIHIFNTNNISSFINNFEDEE